MDELRVEFEGTHYTVQVDKNYSVLTRDYDDCLPVLSMDKQYRLDTAARILIGVLKDAA